MQLSYEIMNTNTRYVNWFVASTNLLTIPFARQITNSSKYLLYSAGIVSAIYHLAETKHSLFGVYPFNKYSNILLNIDRLVAIISFGCVMRKAYINPNVLSPTIITTGLFGVGCMLWSERDQMQCMFKQPKWYLRVNKVDFMISHTIWHCTAFYVMAHILSHC